MLTRRRIVLLAGLCLVSHCVAHRARAEDDLPARAARALRAACDAYYEQVSTNGGFLYQYSADLSAREGEGKAGPTTVWVQPPGTPAVGLAMLDAYRWTGDKHYLQLAQRTGECLRRGQLESGGWDYLIEFAEQDRKRYAYRTDGGKGNRNTTTLDDNKTQEALRFLIRLDSSLKQQDKRVHEMVIYALDKLLDAQYPNGAFPQGFSGPPDAAKHPVREAAYPDEWSRTFPKLKYQGHYTFNDNALADVIDVLLLAGSVYRDDRYQAAAMKAGDFILLAQMPDPQPGWAQQYNEQMHPAWARKFEPPAITGGEAQSVMRLLLRLYERTGERKYYEAVGRALPYYRRCLLPDGRLARFYELQTNKPLYFTRDYKLVYTDDDLPTHYAFKVSSKLDQIEREYKRLDVFGPVREPRGPRKVSDRQAEMIIDALDERHLWVEDGSLKHTPGVKRVIRSQTFIRRVELLAQYLAGKK